MFNKHLNFGQATDFTTQNALWQCVQYTDLPITHENHKVNCDISRQEKAA